MLFIPSGSKFKKEQKGKSFRRINKDVNYVQLKYGFIGLKAVSSGRVSSKEVKTVRQVINKILKKKAFVRINIFPQTPITKKPLEIRMGKGKGGVNSWVFKVRPGMVLVEIQTEFKALALKALKLVQIRLSLSTKVINM
jgi:large subunit ribosomal protein L16